MVQIAATRGGDAAAQGSTYVARLRDFVGRHPEVLVSPAALLLVLAAWELAPGWLGISTLLIPPPSETFLARPTVCSVVIFCLTSPSPVGKRSPVRDRHCAAFIVGGITAYSRLFERTIYGYLLAIQTMRKWRWHRCSSPGSASACRPKSSSRRCCRFSRCWSTW